MKKYITRAIAMLLSILMISTSMPLVALAEENAPNINLTDENVSASGENEICTWHYDSETSTLYIDGETISPHVYGVSDQNDELLPIYVNNNGARDYCYFGFENLVFGESVNEIFDIYIDNDVYPNLKTVTFDENATIEKVSDYLFWNCHTLETVNLCDSIDTIGYSAFEETGLREINLDNVVIICPYAFSYCNDLEYVNLEKVYAVEEKAFWHAGIHEANLKGAAYIRNCAFWDCSNLQQVIFGEKLKSIEYDAFKNTSNAEFSPLPEGLKTIGRYAFFGAKGLKSLYIPKSVTSIGTQAFMNCSSLQSVVFDDESSIDTIPESCFSGCTSLTDIHLPDTVIALDSFAFSKCNSLESFVSNNIVRFGSNCLGSCENLKRVTICSFYVEINPYAFENSKPAIHCQKDSYGYKFAKANGLKMIFKGDDPSLADIDELIEDFDGNFGKYQGTWDRGTWSFNHELDTLYINGNGPIYSTSKFVNNEKALSIEELLWLGDIEINVVFGEGITDIGTGFKEITNNGRSFDTIYFPSTMTQIRDNAFQNSRVKAIVLGENITQIGTNAFTGSYVENIRFASNGKLERICNSAFYHNRLKSLELPSTLDCIETGAFTDGKLESLDLSSLKPDVSLGLSIFESNRELAELNLGSVQMISNRMFRDCQKLTRVVIPNGVTNIGQYAFENCSSLKEVVLPKSVTELYSSAFRGCSLLDTIDTQYLTSVGSYAFYECYALKEVNLVNTTAIYTSAFYCTDLSEVYLPRITQIQSYAFYKNKNLVSVYAPNCTLIDQYAFYYCTSLSEIDLENPILTAIGNYAFSYTNLEKVHIRKGVTYSRGTFSNCSSLTSVAVDDEVKTMPSSIFAYCSNLENVGISDNSEITSIGDRAFYNCEKMAQFNMPKNLKSIGNYAFANCLGFEEAIFPVTTTSIGEEAFFGCKNLEKAVLGKYQVKLGNRTFNNCSPDLVIYCREFSSGHEYAKANEISFAFYDDNGDYDMEPTQVDYFGTWEHGTWTYSADRKSLYIEPDNNSWGCTLTPTLKNGAGESVTFAQVVSKSDVLATVYIRNGIYDVADNFAKGSTESSFNTLYIDDYVRTIGNYSFANIKFINLQLGQNFTTIGAHAFENCGINQVKYSNSSKVNRIGDYAFYKNNLTQTPGVVSSCVIGAHAFDTNNIQSAGFNSSYSCTVGDYAYANNPLTKIYINKGPSYGEGVFSNGTAGYTEVYIYDGITEIPNYTFKDTKVKKLSFTSSLKRIGSCAFMNSALQSFDTGDSLEYIEDRAFYGSELQTLTIGAGVKEIGARAFGNTSMFRVDFNNRTATIYTDTVYLPMNAIGYREDGTANPGLIIYGYSNSTAERFTKAANLAFVNVEMEDDSDRWGYIAESETYLTNGTPLKWYYFENTDTLYISGNGSMYGKFFDKNGNQLETVPTASSIQITNGVTGLYMPLAPIGASSVNIPNTVTVIDGAFKNCDKIEYISIPDSVTLLYDDAFVGCKALKSLSLGTGLTNIPERCANGCLNLRFLYIYGGESIGRYAFKDCPALTSIVIPKTIKHIRDGAFENCYGVMSITLSAEDVAISSRAFANIPLCDTLIFNCSTGYIAKDAFLNTGDVTSGIDIILGDSVRTISLDGFADSKVSTITVGSSFEKFDEIYNIPSLLEYRVENNQNGYTAYKGCLYKNNTLSYVPFSMESVDIKQGTAAIGENAFKYGNIHVVRIPDGVTKIGDNAFYGAANLKAVRFPSTLQTIGNSAFENCSKIKTLTIPYPVKSLGNKCFKNCRILSSVILPEGLKTIGTDCFNGCIALESIVLPESLDTLGIGALAYIPDLKSVYVWDATIGYNAFYMSGKPTIYTVGGSNAYGYANSKGYPLVAYADRESFADVCFDAIDILSGYLGYCVDGHGDIEWLTVYEGDCEHDGYEIGVCEYCSEILDEHHTTATGHLYRQIAYMRETSTDYGIRVLQCTTCGERFTSYYKPLENVDAPAAEVHSVYGKVEVDTGKNGKTIDNMSVENANIVINGSVVARTDENGHFSFRMKSGTYLMEVQFPYGFTRYVALAITDYDIYLSDYEPIKIVACDFNKDGIIDEADQALFMYVISSRRGEASYLNFVDMNNDGVINAKDYAIIQRFIGTNALTYSYDELTIA